jgi:hypothetical protein
MLQNEGWRLAIMDFGARQRPKSDGERKCVLVGASRE